jgi:lipopolysaccharide transport system ATP-binding protein
MTTAIEANSLSKIYRLGDVAGITSRVRSFLQRSPTKRDFLAALDDVSFSISAGESVGIIGSNGAGKSTLLKVLARVTAPSSGHGIVRGRVSAILEVGTGFHLELTGRENVFLCGAILGLTRREMTARFDEIIDFAGVDKFVDTPVKRYSSGMYVRLAFAVAAHLDPDILIVDEVLAVGDLRFQKRCLQRMEEATNQMGRTILFVSHNLQAVRSLCPRSILLDRGHLVVDGPTSEVIHKYLGMDRTRLDLRTSALENRLNRTGGRARITSVSITGTDGIERWNFRSGERAVLRLQYEVFERLENLGLLISFSSAGDGSVVSTIKERFKDVELGPGERGECSITVDTTRMRPGSFALYICLGDKELSVFEDVIDSNVKLPFLEINSEETDLHRRAGYFEMDYSIEHTTAPLVR